MKSPARKNSLTWANTIQFPEPITVRNPGSVISNSSGARLITPPITVLTHAYLVPTPYPQAKRSI